MATCGLWDKGGFHPTRPTIVLVIVGCGIPMWDTLVVQQVKNCKMELEAKNCTQAGKHENDNCGK